MKKKDSPVKQRGRLAQAAMMGLSLAAMLCQQARAADTIWTKASEVMKDVYTQILTISTIVAVVTAAVALLMMNFSRSGRTVDESRAWLKRIVITWVILNSLGFIMSYAKKILSRIMEALAAGRPVLMTDGTVTRKVIQVELTDSDLARGREGTLDVQIEDGRWIQIPVSWPWNELTGYGLTKLDDGLYIAPDWWIAL